MASTKKIFLVLLSILILMPLGSAHADGAPPPMPGLGGLEPFQYQPTEVQMVYERVEMVLSMVYPEPDNPSIVMTQISVTAWFVMHNQSLIEEKMQVVFPLDDLNRCLSSDQVDPPTYTYYEIEKDTFSARVSGLPLLITDVISDHPYKTENYCQDEQMHWAGFDVTFPVDQDVLIQVNYVMKGSFSESDSLQAMQYVLETGAGWAGPIGKAYIIFHFPYIASPENVRPDTTPGFQYLYDEIYWSFTNLEPTRNDNIVVSFIAPHSWQAIQSSKAMIEENPQNADAWTNLINTYTSIGSCYAYKTPRDWTYCGRIDYTYQQAIAANPNNAEMNAKYADFLFQGLGPHIFTFPDHQQMEMLQPVLAFLNRALALDPNNATANEILRMIRDNVSGFMFTPPPTIPPTISPTPSVSRTPSITNTPTIPPSPTINLNADPGAYSDRPTILPLAPTKTALKTSTPLQTLVADDHASDQDNKNILFGVFAFSLLSSAGVITWWSLKRREKQNS